MNPKHLLLALSLSLSLFGAGCSRGFDIKTPDGFAELDSSDDYRYRATSADGVVLAVRREKNDPKGSLQFWASAIGNELSERGYGTPETERVKSKDGTAGQRLEYKTHKNGRPNVLWITVFVSDSRIVVVETGGDAEHFKKVEKELATAVASIEVG